MDNTLFSILSRIQQSYWGFLVGFFNIESGLVAISDEIFLFCDKCDWSARSITEECKACGKDGTNYIRFKSGSGDGVYSLFRFFKKGLENETDNVEESIGGLLFLDWIKNGSEVLPYFLDNQNPRRVDLDFFYDLADDCEGEYIGSVICKTSDGAADWEHCLFFGDAYLGNTGSDAILYSNLSPGEYAIYLFNSLALFIRKDEAIKYGLTTNFRFSKVELENFALGKENEAVRSHVTPMGLNTVCWNYELIDSELVYELQANGSNTLATDFDYTQDGNPNHPVWELFYWLVQMERLGIDVGVKRIAEFLEPSNSNYEYWANYKLEVLKILGILK